VPTREHTGTEGQADGGLTVEGTAGGADGGTSGRQGSLMVLTEASTLEGRPVRD
jgi:hypothetical protein